VSDVDVAVRHSPIESVHRELGATFTEFGGWLLPLRFSGDLAEHRAVRARAGVFDISHMGQITVSGRDASTMLARSVVSNVGELEDGRARYTMICNEEGGVLDDLIVYRLADEEFLVIANAANTDVVVSALADRVDGGSVVITDCTSERGLISIQGPASSSVLSSICPSGAELPKRFRIASLSVGGHAALVARTGYTGEDGFEFSVARSAAPEVWRALLSAGEPEGVVPVGLGARDSLRLEAALPLYGHELSASRTPYAAGYGSIVDLDHVFVGDQALGAVAARGDAQVLVGLVCAGQRAPRQGYTVVATDGTAIGAVTSGGPSPTLGVPIALAYLDRSSASVGLEVGIDVRGRLERAKVVPLPFYRRSRLPSSV
jgi:aminomethyltransferase